MKTIQGQINIFDLCLANDIANKFNTELDTLGYNKGCHRIGKIEFKNKKAIAWTFRVLYHSHGEAAKYERPPVPPEGWELICGWFAWYWRKTISISSDLNDVIPIYYKNLCKDCHNSFGIYKKMHCAAGFYPDTVKCAEWYEKTIRCLDISFSENEGCSNADQGDGCHGCYERWIKKHDIG